MKLYKFFIHSASTGLTTLRRKSIGAFLVLYKKLVWHPQLELTTLTVLFTLMSKGCSLSVQFGGIKTHQRSFYMKFKTFKQG